MVELAALARRAKASEDGEAFATVAKGTGFRLGIGARASVDGGTTFFVEVVLDPFPDRPRVEPTRVRDQAALGEQLRKRGYDLCCDDAGVITGERTLGEADPRGEVREMRRLLAGTAP